MARRPGKTRHVHVPSSNDGPRITACIEFPENLCDPAHSGHILVETALVATILFLLLQRSYKPDKKPLTEKVFDLSTLRHRTGKRNHIASPNFHQLLRRWRSSSQNGSSRWTAAPRFAGNRPAVRGVDAGAYDPKHAQQYPGSACSEGVSRPSLPPGGKEYVSRHPWLAAERSSRSDSTRKAGLRRPDNSNAGTCPQDDGRACRADGRVQGHQPRISELPGPRHAPRRRGAGPHSPPTQLRPPCFGSAGRHPERRPARRPPASAAGRLPEGDREVRRRLVRPARVLRHHRRAPLSEPTPTASSIPRVLAS